MDVEVRLSETALHLLLHAKHGPAARAVERKCIRVQSTAIQLCPVDTGRLQGTIEYHLDEDSDGVFGIVAAHTEYAAFVELGTSRMAAQPYLRPALAAA